MPPGMLAGRAGQACAARNCARAIDLLECVVRAPVKRTPSGMRPCWKTSGARRALRHFDRALRIQSRDKSSRAYGITQYNRAQAHCRLTQVSPGGKPKVAVTCLEEALAAFQSCGDDRYLRLVRAQLDRIRRQE
jgi:hypothetical protein